jgi:hypothetical protein
MDDFCNVRFYIYDSLATFPIQIGLKQGDAFLLFAALVEHSIRKVQENVVGFKLRGTHQFLVYADVN